MVCGGSMVVMVMVMVVKEYNKKVGVLYNVRLCLSISGDVVQYC